MALKLHKPLAIISYAKWISFIFEHIKSIYLNAWWQFAAFEEMSLPFFKYTRCDK